MDVKSSKAISVSEAKDILSERKKDSELGYEQEQALDNSVLFSKYDSDKVRKIMEVLGENQKINKELAVKIIDIRPDNPATLKAILVKDRIELSEEEVEKILKEFA